MNRVYFNKNDIENNLHLKFIQFLLKTLETADYRVDIHVYNEDCGAVVVEFVRQLWNEIEEFEHFVVIDGDEAIVKEVILPDSTLTYATSEVEADKLIKEWYKTHNKKVKEQE